VRTPPLSSQNRFKQLTVENMDTDDNITVVSNPELVANSRGSQETELGALEACLIPSQKCNQPINNKPKEGVMDEKYFIRSVRVE
jgi:hypothetical protein